MEVNGYKRGSEEKVERVDSPVSNTSSQIVASDSGSIPNGDKSRREEPLATDKGVFNSWTVGSEVALVW
jgi:hypothetical protein